MLLQDLEISPEFVAWLLIVVSLITILGVVVFYIFSGDRIQLVAKKRKRAIILFSILPGSILYILTSVFVLWVDSISSVAGIPIDIVNFTLGADNQGGTWLNFMFSALLLSILTAMILKQLSYQSIDLNYFRQQDHSTEEKSEILRTEKLHVHYPIYGGFLKRVIGYVKAVNGVSFNINRGETLGLVGESGCGKSTIAKAILGLIDKNEGEIQFNGEALTLPLPNHLRQQIQIVFQDPDASLNPRMKIVDIVGEPLRNLMGMTNKDEIRDVVFQLLQKVSLKREHLDRHPHEFSGGQKQRITIARALACNPRLIILDEPTSALDVSVQAGILNLLKDLQQDYGYGFLFITHNLSVVNHIADNVAVMYLGRFVEYGPVDEIFSTPMHPYTQALLSARTEVNYEHTDDRIILQGEVPSPINPPSGCTFHPRCNYKTCSEKCNSIPPKAFKYGDQHIVWCYQLENDCEEVDDDYFILKR